MSETGLLDNTELFSDQSKKNLEEIDKLLRQSRQNLKEVEHDLNVMEKLKVPTTSSIKQPTV